MGLTYPRDLGAWQSWHDNSSAARRVLHTVRSRRGPVEAEPQWTLTRGSEHPTILFVLDSCSPTTLAAVLRPLAHLPPAQVAVMSPTTIDEHLPVAGWQSQRVTRAALDTALEGLGTVITAGHYLPLGAAVHAWSTRHAVPTFVVQHGLLTPFAPPLPEGATVLAWSHADADFWRSGRDDLTTHVVGSQLLHEVSFGAQVSADPGSQPLYLGQLHGAELPRAKFARSAYRFCRDHDAVYRPHPSERDKASRLIHTLWRRRGITFDTSGRPLAQLDRPVVSTFSTGVLEAAARGLPAWVDFDDPPPWLSEFWERYGMSRWGGEPTPAPQTTAQEPAAAIAAVLQAATP